MPSRTLATSAVLFLLLMLPACCMSEPHFRSGPMAMPAADNVGEVGLENGLPMTATVSSGNKLGDPLMLTLTSTNVLNHPCFCSIESKDPSHFAIWVLFEDRQVPLTSYGAKEQPRFTVWGRIFDGPSYTLAPGAAEIWQIDLAKLFRIQKAGEYTVVVEDGATFLDNSDPRRELLACKTSFMFLSENKPSTRPDAYISRQN